MADFIIEYVVVQKRLMRISAPTKEDAIEEIQRYHEQHESEMENEVVMLTSVEEDGE